MNWTTLNTTSALRAEADKELKKIKKNNKGQKMRLVKVCDKPLTFKEIPCEE